VVVAFGRGEEGSTYRRVGHRGEVTHHDVQGLDGVVRDLTGATLQGLFQSEQRDLSRYR
jgi:hypothetical protein